MTLISFRRPRSMNGFEDVAAGDLRVANHAAKQPLHPGSGGTRSAPTRDAACRRLS
jgi:hypothetical protein